MKKFLCLSLLLVVVLAFAGCEAGLTSNDGTGTSGDNDFSFSDMYAKIKTLQEELDRLRISNADLESTLEGVTRLTDPNTGQPTIRFSGVNVQIVNGLGRTNGLDNIYEGNQKVNGLGNLIVGYNELQGNDLDNRTGSHNIIVGLWNNYSSCGGFVAGIRNTVNARWSSVSGGDSNIADGLHSSVSGGYNNTASGERSSVSGGYINTSSGRYSSVSGGHKGESSGEYDWRAGELFQGQ